MTDWIVAIVVALVGVVCASALRITLRRGGHRRADEQALPVRRLWWLLVLLPVAMLVVDHELAVSRHPVVGVLYAAACVPLLALVAIDVDVHRLPDRITLPFVGAAVLVAAVASAITRDGSAFGRAVIAGVVLFAVAFLVMFASPGAAGIGFGDVKLLAGLGVLTGWLGWAVVLSAVLLAFLAAGLWAAALLISRRADRHTAIAFGPFLIGGALVALLGG